MSASTVAPNPPVGAFVQLWAECISSVMSHVASAPCPMQESTGETFPAPSIGDVQLTVAASGAARGEMNLRLPPATALGLAKIVRAEADTARAELNADDRTALEELFRQIAGQVSTSSRPKGLEIQLTVVVGEAPTWSPGARGWICSGPDAPSPVQIEWSLSSALATGLVAATREPEPPAVAPTPSDRSKDPSKFALLMDVELDLTLRFGGRNVLLREILDLGPGSVLELDRNIQDDADLLLDGKLIARGEVVVVERNFGIRITEVLPGQGQT